MFERFYTEKNHNEYKFPTHFIQTNQTNQTQDIIDIIDIYKKKTDKKF